jgi:hypothetical protein
VDRGHDQHRAENRGNGRGHQPGHSARERHSEYRGHSVNRHRAARAAVHRM